MRTKLPNTQAHRIADKLHTVGEGLTASQIVARVGGTRTSAIHRLHEMRRKGLVKVEPIIYVPTEKFLSFSKSKIWNLKFK